MTSSHGGRPGIAPELVVDGGGVATDDGGAVVGSTTTDVDELPPPLVALVEPQPMTTQLTARARMAL